MTKLHRILIPTDSDDPQSWQAALGAALAINQACSPAIRDVVLFLPVKQNLKSTGLEGFIGKQHSKMLRDGKTLQLPDDANLRLETKQTSSYGFPRKTTIIAFYTDDRILEMIDGLQNVAGVVAVPDYTGRANEWKSRWAPLVPGEEKAELEPLIDDPIIIAALESISPLMNKSKGVLTAPYADWANDVLRILRAKGHFADPKDVKSWAIRDGWTPGAANELGKLAGKIFKLKAKPSLRQIANAEERYERWKNGET